MNKTPPLRIGLFETGDIDGTAVAASDTMGCIERAVAAERVGFHRVWLSENHRPDKAWSSPLPLMPLILRETRRIRVGTGAIVLPLHPPLAVAEHFRFLQGLHPGRLDCGVTAGMTDAKTLAEYGWRTADHPLLDECFDRRLLRLLRLFAAGIGDARGGPGSLPQISAEVWVVGSTLRKGLLAAETGASFCYSLMHPNSLGDPGHLAAYYDRFGADRPYAAVAIRVACAETSARAEAIPLPPDLPFPQVVGTPEDCVAQLLEYRERFGVQEIIVKLQGRDNAERLRACELLGAALAPARRPARAFSRSHRLL